MRANLLSAVLAFAKVFWQFPVSARFGDLSRAPLKLLRIAVEADRAECHWIARGPDEWDAELLTVVGQQNESLQALRDAIAVRALLFRILTQVRSATLKIYRRAQRERHELIITGEVRREDTAPKTVRSLAMQAKLLGLQFEMSEGILEELQQEVCTTGSGKYSHK